MCVCVRVCVCVCVSDLSYWSAPSKFTCVYYRSGYWYFYRKHVNGFHFWVTTGNNLRHIFAFSGETRNRKQFCSLIICKIFAKYLFINIYLQNNTQGFDLVSADSRHTQTPLLPVLRGAAQLCHLSLLNRPPKRKEGKERGGRKPKQSCPKAAAPMPFLSSFLKHLWNAYYVKANAPRTEDAEKINHCAGPWVFTAAFFVSILKLEVTEALLLSE